VVFETVPVGLHGWNDKPTPRTGEIVKYDIAPDSASIAGFSVATNEIEWMFVADDTADMYPANLWPQDQPTGCGGNRHCEYYAVYSGTMKARAYTNGIMRETDVGHIKIVDEFFIKVLPSYGPSGFRAVATASKSDGSAMGYIGGWYFHPDSAPSTYTQVCGAQVNPCIFNPTTSGRLEAHAIIGNRWKVGHAHVDVVPCQQNDSLQDNPDFRRLERMLWDSSHSAGPDSIRVERAGFLIDSAGVWKTLVAPLNADTSRNSACYFNASYPNLGAGWVVKALVHTHPWPDSASLAAPRCPKDAQGNPLKYGPTVLTGWASANDWKTSADLQIPSYIIDFNRVVRLRGDSANLQPLMDAAGTPLLDGNGKLMFVPDSAGLVNHYKAFRRTGGSCSATSARIPLISGGLPLRERATRLRRNSLKAPTRRAPAGVNSRIAEGI
jgi:hypothetical protein